MLVVCSYCGAEVPLPPSDCEQCGAALPVDSPSSEGASWEDERPMALHPMSEAKFLAMNVCSFGLYTTLWFFRNWLLLRYIRGERNSPALRMIFYQVAAVLLFRSVKREAEASGVEPRFRPGLLAVVYFVASLAVVAPGSFALLGLLSPVVLFPVQRTINEINERSPRPVPMNDRFSRLNVVLLVLGGLVLVLGIVGSFLPEP